MKQRIKKILALVLGVAFCLGLVACDKQRDEKNYKEPEIKGTWVEDMPFAYFAEPADVIDFIDVSMLTDEIIYMLDSLKFVVNSTQPRIFTQDKDTQMPSHDLSVNWLDTLGCKYVRYTDPFDLMEKYRAEYQNVVIYDATMRDTLNLADAKASLTNAIVASPVVYGALEARGIKLNIVEDYRNRFSSKLEIYEYMYENLWPYMTHKAISSRDPVYISMSARDYTMAAKIACVWLDTLVPEEKELLGKFFADMIPGESALLGWTPVGNEPPLIEFASSYGIPMYCDVDRENGIFFSSYKRDQIAVRPQVDVKLENKVYVAFVVSDGDNYGYHQHRMKQLWDEHMKIADKMPLSWTFSPAAQVVQPAIMNYYLENATENTGFLANLISYTYSNQWPKDNVALKKMLTVSNKYLKQVNFQVVNNWGDGGGWTEKNSVRDIFAEYMPNVSTVYDQAPHDNENLDGMLYSSLSFPYVHIGECSVINTEIDMAYSRYLNSEKNQPAFASIMACPWIYPYNNNGRDLIDEFYASFQYAKEKYGDDVEFVTIEELSALQRMAQGMPPVRVQQ